MNCAGVELVYFTRFFVSNNYMLSFLPPDILSCQLVQGKVIPVTFGIN